MRLNILLQLFLFLFIISCNEQKTHNENSVETIEKTSEPELLITKEGAGGVLLGKSKADIKLQEGQKFSSSTVMIEEGIEETRWLIDENNQSVIGFFLINDKIFDIEIYASKYKTAEGIGVNSTLKELQTAYPEVRFWYTYVRNWYVAETASYPNVQFMIDPKAYTGDDNKIKQPAEQVSLSFSDFDSDGNIIMIRMYDNL